MDSNCTVSCTINLEYLNPQGVVQRKVTHKKGLLRVIRNEFRNMFVEVSAEKSQPIKLMLKGITVHNKFMNEGKSSMKFQDPRCTLYLSNAPPAQLSSFFKTIFIKMTGAKEDKKNLDTSLRTQLLSNKPRQFEEISPVTNAELEAATKKITKATDTTPSPLAKKRKLNSDRPDRKAPAAKKLYAASPLLDEPLNIEQKEVMDACLSGSNIFFTGSAGTGKSYLLRKIIAALPPDVTVATASTGKYSDFFKSCFLNSEVRILLGRA